MVDPAGKGGGIASESVMAQPPPRPDKTRPPTAAVAGKTYAFQMAPRADATRAVARMFGLAGVVIEAAAKGETAGPFKLTQVAP